MLDHATLSFRVGYPAGWTVSHPAPDLPLLESKAAGARLTIAHYGNGRPDVSTRELLAAPKATAGEWREHTIAGRPGASYWIREPMPRPGVAGPGCCTDPVPDVIYTYLTAAMDGNVFIELRGAATVDAKPIVHCEIQAILASFVPTK